MWPHIPIKVCCCLFQDLTLGGTVTKHIEKALSLVQQQLQYVSALSQWMESLCIVLYERPVEHQQCLNMNCFFVCDSHAQTQLLPLLSLERKAWCSHPLNLSLVFYHWRQYNWKITGVACLTFLATLAYTVPLAHRHQRSPSLLKHRSLLPFFPGRVNLLF